MTQRPYVGIGVIVMNKNKLLLGKRKGAHGEGSWGLPGGHLEYKESLEACALRELLEETGLKGSTATVAGVSNDIFQNQKHYVTVFMRVEKVIGEVQNCEPEKCEEWKWFSMDELPKPLFLPLQGLLLKNSA